MSWFKRPSFAHPSWCKKVCQTNELNQFSSLADYAEEDNQRQRAKDERIQKKIQKALNPPAKKLPQEDSAFFEVKDQNVNDVKSAVLKGCTFDSIFKF